MMVDMIDRVGTAIEQSVEQALRIFRALGDENRLRLIAQLRDGEQCVCDLSEAIGASQPLLSFHLKTLKDAGLVTDRREGRWVYYTLNAEAVEDAQRLLGQMKPPPTALRKGARRCD
jgi:ArsR family transcriptional regulator, arsenate/arsenite/antimonite-responsive transcriptional repressor